MSRKKLILKPRKQGATKLEFDTEGYRWLNEQRTIQHRIMINHLRTLPTVKDVRAMLFGGGV